MVRKKSKKQYSAAEKKSFRRGLLAGLRIGKGKNSNKGRRTFRNKKRILAAKSIS